MEEAGERGNGADTINCILREKKEESKKASRLQEPLAKAVCPTNFSFLVAETPLLLKASLSPLCDSGETAYLASHSPKQICNTHLFSTLLSHNDWPKAGH